MNTNTNKKILSTVAIGAVIYGVSELWYQTGKAAVIGSLIENGCMSRFSDDEIKKSKVWPTKYVYSMSNGFSSMNKTKGEKI